MEKYYLLDTHSLLWFFNGDKNLSMNARKAIANTSNRCFVSMASLWEMAIKIKLGKLTIDFALEDLTKHLKHNQIQILPIAFEHILFTLKLTEYHRDPFDRLIIAQAQIEKLIIISKDKNFQQYAGTKLLW